MPNPRNRKSKLQEKTLKRQQLVKIQEKPVKQTNCCAKCIYALLFMIGLFVSLGYYSYLKAPFTARTLQVFSEKTELVGVLTPNTKLANCIKKHGIPGPEAIEEDGENNLYVSLSDGRIARIAPSKDGVIGGGKVTNLTMGLVSDFEKSAEETEHGRPLGLRLLNDKLFVADVWLGIYSVDINTQKVSSLVRVDDVNPPLRFTDDLYVTKNGKMIYFTDGSVKYDMTNTLYMVLEGVCDGRVLQYNVETKQVLTVVSNLCFCNGIQFSDNEEIMLVAETLRYRIRTIDTRTWKTIKITSVPIMPDNIRSTGLGTYWLAGSNLLSNQLSFLEQNPVARQILGGLFSIQQLTQGFSSSKKTYNILLEINDDGEILQSLHDPEGEATFQFSHAHPLSDGRIAICSYVAPYLAILNEKNVALGLG